MKTARTQMKPRKAPVQARSLATVEAIHEAAVQVLVSEGLARLNTTRVAERAGVSVGSLYQYYPNKGSLLAAILERYLCRLAEVVEQACAGQHGRPLDEMARALVTAFVDTKMARPDVSKALYAIGEEHGGAAFVARANARGLVAINAMLESAPDAKASDLELVSSTLLGAMVGPVRNLLETDASPRRVAKVRGHLILLISAYLSAAIGAR